MTLAVRDAGADVVLWVKTTGFDREEDRAGGEEEGGGDVMAGEGGGFEVEDILGERRGWSGSSA